MRIKILLLFTVLLFTNCTSKKSSGDAILDFIPDNTALLFKVNDLESLKDELSDNEFISKIKETTLAKTISDKIKPLQYLVGNAPGIIALSNGIADDFDFTYIATDSLPVFNFDTIRNKTVESLAYNTYTLTKYTIAENTFFTTILKEHEILSSSQKVLENLISNPQNNNASLVLEKLYKTSSNNRLSHVWINVSKCDSLLSKLIGKKDILPLAPKYADWISLAIEMDNNNLLLNGISTVKEDIPYYLGLFSNTKPLRNTITSYIPSDIDDLRSYTIQNYSAFLKNQHKYLNKTIAADSLLKTVEEVGIVTLNKKRLVFIKTYGTANISDYLTKLKSGSIEYQGSEILKLQGTSFLNEELAPFVTDFKVSYSSILENTFVFSNDEEVLKKVITSYKNGNVFEKTMRYKNVQAITTEESSALTLATSSTFKEQLNKYGLNEMAVIVENSAFNNYIFGSQIIADTDFFHTSYFVKQINASETKSGVTSLFNFQVDSDIITGPQFVKNHRTKKQEIVIQDQENILYLISSKGKLLWKKQLESPIQGKINQVDIYKNGKLQLAFTTNNKFLILDRNGKEVAPFTIKHEGGNLNPLAIFDYEGNKEYRFVVTQGKKVFMYNNKGKIVSGFKYKQAESDILTAPQHFKINRKDYLCFKLSNGQLKILNRVGDTRIKVAENISFSANNIKLYKNNFTLTTAQGVLYQINTKGKTAKTNLNLNPDHGMDATSKTLALINDNILTIRDKKVALDLGVYSQPTIFYLNDKIYVSVTDIQNQKSYLFDSQAKTIPNFPIYGASIIDLADMDNDKKPELVIKDQDNSFVVYKIR